MKIVVRVLLQFPLFIIAILWVCIGGYRWTVFSSEQKTSSQTLNIKDNDEKVLIEEPKLVDVTFEKNIKQKENPIQNEDASFSPEKDPEKSLSQDKGSEIQAMFHKAKDLIIKGKVESAKEILLEMEPLDEKAKALRDEIFYLSCRNWALKKEYGKALLDCEKAQDHFQAKKFVDEMTTLAKKYYFQAYALEKVYPKEAFDTYKKVLLFAPSQSVWKKKTLKQLKALSAYVD